MARMPFVLVLVALGFVSTTVVQAAPAVFERRAAANLEPTPVRDAMASRHVHGRTTFVVGPTRAYRRPSEVAGVAQDGDTILIEGGIYENDFAIWDQSNLTIRGIEGRPVLTSSSEIPNGKAIWIIRGDNIVLERLEFSGAHVADGNGAGVRHEGKRLIIRDSYFHHNELAILAGSDPGRELVVERTEIAWQSRDQHFSHGLYVGSIASFTIRFSFVHHTSKGHQIKSRAFNNFILYNRIEDIGELPSSYLVDLPNCGMTYVIGNVLKKAPNTLNKTAIAYGAEGCEDRTRELFVINNTIVDESRMGQFVTNFDSGLAYLVNNLLMGSGKFLVGAGRLAGNYRAQRSDFVDIESLDLHLSPQSVAVNRGSEIGLEDEPARWPSFEYVHPASGRPRPRSGRLDVGAYEYSH